MVNDRDELVILTDEDFELDEGEKGWGDSIKSAAGRLRPGSMKKFYCKALFAAQVSGVGIYRLAAVLLVHLALRIERRRVARAVHHALAPASAPRHHRACGCDDGNGDCRLSLIAFRPSAGRHDESQGDQEKERLHRARYPESTGRVMEEFHEPVV